MQKQKIHGQIILNLQVNATVLAFFFYWLLGQLYSLQVQLESKSAHRLNYFTTVLSLMTIIKAFTQTTLIHLHFSFPASKPLFVWFFLISSQPPSPTHSTSSLNLL